MAADANKLASLTAIMRKKPKRKNIFGSFNLFLAKIFFSVGGDDFSGQDQKKIALAMFLHFVFIRLEWNY